MRDFAPKKFLIKSPNCACPIWLVMADPDYNKRLTEVFFKGRSGSGRSDIGN
jgi:hypothetical protein